MTDTTTDLRQRVGELQTLHAISEVLNREPEYTVALQQALERLLGLVAVDTGWVFLVRVPGGDPHFAGIELRAWAGLPPALSDSACAALREGGCECEGRFRRGELDAGINIVECSRLDGAVGDRRGLEIHASVPLTGRGGAPLGILNLASAGREPFDRGTLRLLDAVGHQLGVAYERAQLLAEREEETRQAAARAERDRIAREVHDAVSQQLFAAKLALEVAREGHGSDQGAQSLARAADLVGSAMQELRSLIELLRSADLQAGLVPALQRLADRTTGTMKVAVQAAPVTLPAPVEDALYRCAQEAVHNSMKHAEADHVWIRLDVLSRSVRLAVEDDGVGYPDPVVAGVGLTSLERRVTELGGRIRCRNRRPRGARLEAMVPWRSGS